MLSNTSKFVIGLVVLIIIATVVTVCVLVARPHTSHVTNKQYSVSTNHTVTQMLGLQHSGNRDSGSISFTLSAPSGAFDLIIKYVEHFATRPTLATLGVFPGVVSSSDVSGFVITYSSSAAVAGDYNFSFTNT